MLNPSHFISVLTIALVASSGNAFAGADKTATTTDDNTEKVEVDGGAKKPSTSVLVLDLKYGDGITKDNAYVMTQEVATELARDTEVRVQTVEDSRVTLGVEAQKQMVGCDETSCLAEIAQAMGTDMLLFGRLDRVGDQVTLQLTLLDAATAQPKERVSAKDKDVASILVRMNSVLLNTKRAINPNVVIEEPPPPLLLYGGLAGAGVGAAVMVGCAIAGAIAYAQMTNFEVHSAATRNQTRDLFFWPAVAIGSVATAAVVAGGVVAVVGMSE